MKGHGLAALVILVILSFYVVNVPHSACPAAYPYDSMAGCYRTVDGKPDYMDYHSPPHTLLPVPLMALALMAAIIIFGIVMLRPDPPYTGKNFATTITSANMRLKEADHQAQGYFDEYKNNTDHWAMRLDGVGTGAKAVFLEGNKPHRYTVVDVFKIAASEVPQRYQAAVETRRVNVIRCR